ncbi:MAG: XRE family transcriptional regulator [Acidobacteriota bacterium]
MADLRSRVGRNIRDLRAARNLTQEQMARLSGLPRATWSHVESGAANPTLEVLHRVASALRVSLEELISEPRAACRFYPKGSLPTHVRGEGVVIRKFLPDKVPGMEIERMELPPASRLTGIPHMPGTREYLACEQGTIVLVAAGEKWKLTPGDVVVFRGDQRHSYHNKGASTAVGYSIVMLAPPT